MVYGTFTQFNFNANGNDDHFVSSEACTSGYRIFAILRFPSLACKGFFRQAFPISWCSTASKMACNGQAFIERLNYMRRATWFVFVREQYGHRIECQARVDRIGGSIVDEPIFTCRSNAIRAGSGEWILSDCVISSVVVDPLRRQEVSITRELRAIFYRASKRNSNISFNGSCVRDPFERFERRCIRQATAKRNQNGTCGFEVNFNRFRGHVSRGVLGREERSFHVNGGALANSEVRLTKHVPFNDIRLYQNRSFSFCNVWIRSFESLRIFCVSWCTNRILRVISISEARMTSIRSLRSILLLYDR